MELSNFSSLAEITVTFNIAFVAIEYVKSFSRVLSTRVLSLGTFIDEKFGECEALLADRETLEHCHPIEIHDKETSRSSENVLHLESVKRKIEIQQKKIEEKKKNIVEGVESICETKSISSISMWLSFYGLVAMTLMGFESESDNNLIHLIWMWLTLFSLIYIICGATLNKKHYSCRLINFSSLLHPIAAIFLSLCLSVIFALLSVSLLPNNIRSCVSIAWTTSLLISMAAMYSNFIVSTFKIYNGARKLRKKVEDTTSNLKEECKPVQKDINELIIIDNYTKRFSVSTDTSTLVTQRDRLLQRRRENYRRC